MIDLHPEILKKNGRNEFVVLQEWIAGAQDLLELEAAKREEAHLPRVALEQIEKELGME